MSDTHEIIHNTDCPLCGSEIEYAALSRADNKTEICSDCGVREAYRQAGFSEYQIERLISRQKDFSAGFNLGYECGSENIAA